MSRKRGLSVLAVTSTALALSACGSQRDSARVAAMIEAKYGVSVVGCRIEQGQTAASLQRARQRGLWSCQLGAPRKDKASGVSDRAWCVTNASPDELYESAGLAYPRSTKPNGCR
jgi:hypothetical protein